jgi:hypothetical protein
MIEPGQKFNLHTAPLRNLRPCVVLRVEGASVLVEFPLEHNRWGGAETAWLPLNAFPHPTLRAEPAQ